MLNSTNPGSAHAHMLWPFVADGFVSQGRSIWLIPNQRDKSVTLNQAISLVETEACLAWLCVSAELTMVNCFKD